MFGPLKVTDDVPSLNQDAATYASKPILGTSGFSPTFFFKVDTTDVRKFLIKPGLMHDGGAHF